MNGARGYVIVAIVVMAAVLVLDRILQQDHKQRNSEIFTEMAYSKANEPFSLSASLPGGLTQQHLVPGTVARGLMPLRYGTTPEEALRAGKELQNPLPADDAASLKRGGELFSIYCVACHDAGGTARGQAVLYGMIAPPSLHATRATQMADGEMIHILTYGQVNMASYAAQLSVEERWQVIRHVRGLQEAKKAEKAAKPEDTDQNATEGTQEEDQ